VAEQQAARFSQTCRVFAPVYRQLTLRAIFGEIPASAAAKAYGDVRSAWRDYLRNHNNGRGVVLIGHSQGTYMLRQLARDVIDRRPKVRCVPSAWTTVVVRLRPQGLAASPGLQSHTVLAAALPAPALRARIRARPRKKVKRRTRAEPYSPGHARPDRSRPPNPQLQLP
jgi:pimeloyl-ACP methyl ester carboxylesterase